MAKKAKNDDLEAFQLYEVHIPTRTIYMGSQFFTNESDGEESGVEAKMAERVMKGLHLLESVAESGEKPITIIMNNPGGDLYHSLAIYDAIKSCKNHITIKAYGYVMSGGSLIFQAADERLMSENARFMIHYGRNGMDMDHPKIIKNWQKQSDKDYKLLEELYLERIKDKKPNFKRNQLQKLLDFDTILNAEETIELGLADGIISNNVEHYE